MNAQVKALHVGSPAITLKLLNNSVVQNEAHLLPAFHGYKAVRVIEQKFDHVIFEIAHDYAVFTVVAKAQMVESCEYLDANHPDVDILHAEIRGRVGVIAVGNELVQAGNFINIDTFVTDVNSLCIQAAKDALKGHAA